MPILREKICQIRQEGKRIALVPTMGNLHEGHIKLIDKAKKHADVVVVSIFVNPMQFDCVNDLIFYPRTLREDFKKLNQCFVDLVFVPQLKDIYPSGLKDSTFVDVPIISEILEGSNRPGHFRGVSTIISKLFNLVQPNIACFGEKDYQQLILIQKMVVDLCYDIDIISIPTIRTEDGLAFSSRNNRLTPQQREIASFLNKILNMMVKDFFSKKLSLEKIILFAEQELYKKGFRNNEIKIRDADSLFKLNKNSKRAVILITAWLGHIRLIDNKVFDLKAADFDFFLKQS